MRNIININHDWMFAKKNSGQENFTRVCLPHTTSLTPAISSGGRNEQCVTIYKRSVYLPLECSHQKVIIRFGGAMGVATLWLNGNLLATHTCGYIPFVVDLTNYFLFGKENELMLELDNSDNADVPPGKEQSMLDFTYDGGIYRSATLVTTNRLYITDALLARKEAGGGIFVWSEQVCAANATVHIKTEIKNETGLPQELTLRSYLLDADGQMVSGNEESASLENDTDCTLHLHFSVSAPQLWSPETPYLYTAVCEIMQNGTIVDCVSTKMGIRSFAFTYENGILWNGVTRRISGANYHQTWPYLGNAVPDSLLRRDARKLRAIGIKNIRSHYPLADSYVDECNAIGLTLIVSNPGWQWFKEGAFSDRLLDNMRQIVRWQRNNPSIILWEPIPNESVVPAEFQQLLHDAVHREYPYAPCFTASDHGPTDVSYRMYDPGMLQPGMEGYNPIKRYGTKSDYPVWIREYNDAPDNWTDQTCAWRTPRRWGDYAMMRAVWRMLGKDSQCTTNHYVDVYNNQNICGYGIWPGIEHNRGYHINPCYGGFFDLFRLPKFTSYLMESQQDSTEAGVILHIANWWTEVSPSDVTVCSNAERVRLYHDDVLVEEREPEPIAVKHAPFVFRDVHNRFKQRDRSVLRADAIINGEVVASVTQRTPGVPCALKLEADTMGISFEADGADIIALRCYAVDRDGTTVPLALDEFPILFTAVAGAEIIGDAQIGANPIRPEAGIATVLLRSVGVKGTVTVRAEMFWAQSNLRVAISPAEISFESCESIS